MVAEAIKTILSLCVIFCQQPSRDTETTPPAINNCPVNQMVTAKPMARYAIAHWKEPHAYDAHNNPLKTKHGGPLPGSKVVGKNTVFYTAIDESGSAVTCSFSVNVVVVECENALAVTNAVIRRSKGYPLLGSSMEYECNQGYIAHGDVIRHCERHGEIGAWSKAEPTCTPIHCDALINPKWGVYECTSGNRYLSQCRLRCYHGYSVPMGYNTLVMCNNDDVEPPHFDYCPKDIKVVVDAARNGTTVVWNLPTASDNSRDKVQPVRVGGPMSGSVFNIGYYGIQYIANDTAGNVAACEFHVLITEPTCHPITPFPRQRITCPDGFGLGSKCSLQCAHGYTLNGKDQVICRDSRGNALWDWEQQPYCAPIICPSLSPPLHGRLLCDMWGHKELCRVECDSGYEVPRGFDYPVTQYVCFPSGKWTPSDKVPDCIKSKDPKWSILPSEWYYYTPNCTDNNLQETVKGEVQKYLHKYFLPDTCSSDVVCSVHDVSIRCSPTNQYGLIFRRFIGLASMERSAMVPKLRLSRTMSPEQTYGMLLFVDFKIKVRAKNVTDSFAGRGPMFDRNAHIVAKKVEDSIRSGYMNMSNLGNKQLELEKQSFTYGRIELGCSVGFLPRYTNHTCAACGLGTYYNISSDKCEQCSTGFYQDEQGQTSCKPCHAGMSTSTVGATNVEYCQPMCAPGHFSLDGIQPCSVCPKETYQPNYGSTSCIKCPMGTTTLQMGMTSVKSCSGFDVMFSASSDINFPLLPGAPNDVRNLVTFTLSFWMQVNSSEDIVSFAYVGEEGTGKEPELILFQNPVNLEIETVGYSILANILLGIQQWHHMALTWNGTLGKWAIYKDGLLIASDNLSKRRGSSSNGIFTSHSVTIGGSSFYGDITSLYIWDVILEAGDISLLSSSCEISNIDSIPPLVTWSDFINGLDETLPLRMPSMCDDTNECASNPCHGQATCVDELRSYACECEPGFAGKHCEINIDDCKQNICQNEATCQDGINNYTCKCPHGYKGQLCEIQIINGQWSEWSEWSECSHTCSHGTQSRWRRCDNPAPDIDGKECHGQRYAHRECNEVECPVCKIPHRPLRGFMECANVTDQLDYNCSIYCIHGYRFSTPVQKRYYCGISTGYIWSHEGPDNPRARFPACTELDVPNELVVSYLLKYPDAKCSKNGHTSKTINNVVEKNVNNIHCVKRKECQVKIISSCENRKRRDAEDGDDDILVDIQLSKSVDNTENEINVDNYTGIYYDRLTSLKSAIVELEHSASAIINQTNENAYDVIVNDKKISVNATLLKTVITCPIGSVQNQVFCVKCSIGHFYRHSYCIPCPRDHYQDEEGTLSCKSCPVSMVTDGEGAFSIDECTAENKELHHTVTTDATTTDSQGKKREIYGEIPFLLTFISIPILIIIIIVSIVTCRCWGRRGRIVIWKRKERKLGDKTITLRDRVVLKYDAVTGGEKGDTTDEDELDEHQL
uniref:Sushi, von Willebrand factor type A, EGF and pentraxin domain-containing protein 1-like n=1 Tax=Saccoglossus kowalevskii TaxID=10224 RepID=A0ABM0MNP4_SACKO|nr:PREDICTED: sushi, von Willebrand factor type A, EGF and pentraxin domain-containing protein 1-like [Saccoglossus kowalevskii]